MGSTDPRILKRREGLERAAVLSHPVEEDWGGPRVDARIRNVIRKEDERHRPHRVPERVSQRSGGRIVLPLILAILGTVIYGVSHHWLYSEVSLFIVFCMGVIAQTIAWPIDAEWREWVLALMLVGPMLVAFVEVLL